MLLWGQVLSDDIPGDGSATEAVVAAVEPCHQPGHWAQPLSHSLSEKTELLMLSDLCAARVFVLEMLLTPLLPQEFAARAPWQAQPHQWAPRVCSQVGFLG